MAGPSIAVRVIGDLSNLGQSFKDTADKGGDLAGKLHSSFSGVLGALNQTGVLGPFGEALDGVEKALDTLTKHAKDIPAAMLGVGASLAGIGTGLQALGSKDKAAHQQLQQSVEATGKSYEDYATSVEEAIKHQTRYGHSAAETQDALRIMTQAMGDPDKALRYLAEASDLA
ncbi:MAG TPA: hypothetical protein VGP90_08090, partial [Acidimicrobiia bacterium]|nr:hypothetical protein [Acidimicrobiia bacterium]